MRHHRGATTVITGLSPPAPFTLRAGRGIVLALVLVAAPCGEDGAGDSDLRISCPAGQEAETRCVAPGEVLQGAKLPATFDEKRCQVRGEVKNSCCRPALAGPVLKDGRCCYAFCAGSCC